MRARADESVRYAMPSSDVASAAERPAANVPTRRSVMTSREVPSGQLARIFDDARLLMFRTGVYQDRLVATPFIRANEATQSLGGQPKPAINGQLKAGHFE
jgi:hypothetical protein